MSRRSPGFTLVELLVSMVFLAFFALAVQQFCAALLRGVRVLELASEAQEAARLGVQLIVADAREAGFSPAGRLADGVRRAGPDGIAIARDLDGDGDVDDANERVAYQYASDRRALLRAQGDAPAQPFLADLDDDGLALTYLAADGLPLPGGELDTAQRARIRRVTVRLRLAIRRADPAVTQPIRVEQTASATVRNAGIE